MANPNDILNTSNDKNKYLEEIILAFEKDVQGALKELYIALLEIDLPTDAGKLVFNQKSLTRVQIIDKLIDDVNNTLKDTIFLDFAKRITKAAQFSKDMYMAAGYSEEALLQVEAAISLVSQKLGISTSGKIIRGGYLDTVANADVLKIELKNIIINGISSGATTGELKRRMRDIVLGSSTKDSKLIRYYKTFIHDSVYKTSRMYDKVIGEALGVNQFMYANDIINTSRDFCISRAYKIFTRKEIEGWKDLDYPYFPQPYDPFVDCGGYNCRHWLVPVEKNGEEIKGINEAADKWRAKAQEELK